VRSLDDSDWRSAPRRLDGGDKEMCTGGMGRWSRFPHTGYRVVSENQSVSQSLSQAVERAHRGGSLTSFFLPFALGEKKENVCAAKRARNRGPASRFRKFHCRDIALITLPLRPLHFLAFSSHIVKSPRSDTVIFAVRANERLPYYQCGDR